MNNTGKFSVLMSLYHKEKPEWLDLALKSITDDQALKPSEIVMVLDGPVGNELEKVLEKYEHKYPDLFNIVSLPENKGLGNALNIGLKHCKYDIVARMDSDDISSSRRFEIQYQFMMENPDIDVVSAWYSIFNDEPYNIDKNIFSPTRHEGIVKVAKYRSPINHAACMYRKKAVIEVGNYSENFRVMQDYHLWIRMIARGYQFGCIPKVLYLVRCSELSKKRVGLKRLLGQIKIHSLMYKLGNINLLEYSRNIVSRTVCAVTPYGFVVKYVSFISKRSVRNICVNGQSIESLGHISDRDWQDEFRVVARPLVLDTMKIKNVKLKETITPQSRIVEIEPAKLAGKVESGK